MKCPSDATSHLANDVQKWLDSAKNPVDLRGRYLNLPSSRLRAVRQLLDRDFRLRIRELHELIAKNRMP